MFKKILNVLNIISQIILMLTAVVSMFTAYIVFAPDNLPKPFHLLYDTSPITPVAPSEPIVAQAPVVESHTYQPGDGIMINMSTKIINLLDPGGRKYIRLTVVVEFAPDNPEYAAMAEEEKAAYVAEFENRLNARMPIMDDTVITLLSTKTYDELYTAEGKENLRTEIMNTLSEKMPDQHIISIYFTEFVVQ